MLNSSTYSGSRTDLNLTKTQKYSSNQWHAPTSQNLNLTGSGNWFGERITLRRDNPPSDFFADNVTEIVSHNASISFANGTSYVPISLLSLNPGTVSSPTTLNASAVGYSLLSESALDRNIPSNSWGLHIGSGAFNITGSMYFGGYDQNRVIEEPATFSDNVLSLTSITLGTISGVSPWDSQDLSQNYLKANGSIVNTLQAAVDPSLPYLYLPADTCLALARVLPIRLDTGLNLYIWDTSRSGYNDIISSPSFLNFTFSDSSQKPVSIKVPFSLFNLTLDTPITTTPTPYFPCMSSSPSNLEPWSLGRAFLQAAYIGQNNDAKVFWLAQAPGPKLPTTSPIVKTISSSDKTILKYSGAPSWEDTWSEVLKPLTASSATNGSPSTASGNEPSPSPSNSSLSSGAKAGIAVGVIIGVLLLAIFALLTIRYRRQQRSSSEKGSRKRPQSFQPHGAELVQPGPHNDWGFPNKASGMEQTGNPPPFHASSRVRHETHGWNPTEVSGDALGQRVVEVQGDDGFRGEGGTR